MKEHELAQINIENLVAPLDSAELADFVDNLEQINALADNAPGFIWRLQTDEGDATGFTDFGTEFIVNMSVWRDIESLHKFVYRSGHTEIMSRRREWFKRMDSAYSVLWWVRTGHQPIITEAKEKLELLRSQGPTMSAFTFKKAFPPATTDSEARGIYFDDTCPAI